MKIKEIELKPILLEKVCPHCDGELEHHETKLIKKHFFNDNEYLYRYRCRECGEIIESTTKITLKRLGFKNEETGQIFTTPIYSYRGYPID